MPHPLVDLSLQPRRIRRAGDASSSPGGAGGDGAGESPDLAARHSARRAVGLGGSAKLSPLALAIVLAAAGMILVIHGWRSSGRGARHDGVLGWRLVVQPALGHGHVHCVLSLSLGQTHRTVPGSCFQFRAMEMYNQGVIWSELNVDGPVDALGRHRLLAR